MSERKPYISRRDFLRLAGVLAGGGAAIWAANRIATIFRWTLEANSEANSLNNITEEQFLQSYKNEVKDLPAVQTPTAEPTNPVETPEPTPEIKPKIDFWDANTPIQALIALPSQNVLIRPFRVLVWERDVNLNNLDKKFAPSQNTALMYLDTKDRPIIWAHSGIYQGRYMVMKAVQDAVERDSRGYFVTPAGADKKLKEEFIGSTVDMEQGSNLAKAKIVAAVRVPPDKTQESTINKLTIVEWLGANFPGYGFENLPDNAFVMRTCGQRIDHEQAVEGVPYYEQTRIFLGMVFG